MEISINSNLSKRDLLQFGRLNAKVELVDSEKQDVALAVCFARHELVKVDGVSYDEWMSANVNGNCDKFYRAAKAAVSHAIREHWGFF